MSRQVLPAFIAGVLAICVCSPARGTGPSYIEIEISPIAINSGGEVLFKTKKRMNESGGHSFLMVVAEYGWLCASSKGVWQERTHRTIDARIDSVASFEQVARDHQVAELEFERREGLGMLPDDLEELVEECGTGEWRTVANSTGLGQARWSPMALCVDGQCSDSRIEQKTLGGLVSRADRGSVAESVFYFQGLALFKNISSYNLEQAGAYFEFENSACADCAFDTETISGISILAPPD